MEYQAQRKEKAKDTRRAIMEAASQLIRQNGFEKMTVRDICARAGVTTGAFYHHFASKEALLVQGFSSLDDHLEESLAAYDLQDPAEKLVTLLRCYAQYTEDLGWQNMALYYTRRLSDPEASSMSPDRFTLRTMRECFEELARRGELAPAYDPARAADFCFRHFRGVLIDWILHRGGYPLWPKLEEDYGMFDLALRAWPDRPA